MSRTYDIALCDATSLAGQTLIGLLQDEGFPVGVLYPLSDTAEKGATVAFHGEELDVLIASGFEFADADLLFIPAGGHGDEQQIQQAIESGCMIIDGRRGAAEQYGSVLAMDAMTPERLEAAFNQRRVVIPATPAALLLPVLQALSTVAAIERVDVTACQSVSREGDGGIMELRKQTIALLNGLPAEAGAFARRTAYNLVPQVGTMEPSGHSSEECILDAELRQGLCRDDLDIRSTCLVAPVFFGDSLAVSLDFDRAVNLDEVRQVLSSTALITLSMDGDYPTVEQAAGADGIMVGRLRTQPANTAALSFWLAADAVRQGALLAVQVAQALIKDFLR